MRGQARRRGGWAAAGAAVGALALAGAAQGRGLTPDDVLRREAFGQVLLAPGERWLVVERRGPYADAVRFDYDRYTDILRTTLAVADLAHPGRLRPLFPPEPGVGYQAGPISPDGARLAVFRLKAGTWELGVASLPAGDVRWLGVTPDVNERGRTVQWADAGHLLAIVRPTGDAPRAFTVLRSQRVAAQLHAAAARGAPTAAVLGSGRYLHPGSARSPDRLISIDMRTLRPARLAEGDLEDLEVSPSGTWAAVLEAGAPIGLRPDRPVQGPQGTEVTRLRLRLIRLATGESRRPCETCDVLGQLLSWAPRADRLLVFVRADGEAWTEGRLAQVDPGAGLAIPGAGQVAPVVQGRPATVAAGWLDGDPLVFARSVGSPRGRADWYRLGVRGAVALTAGLTTAPPRQGVAVDGATLLIAAGGQALRIGADGRPFGRPFPAFVAADLQSPGPPPRFGRFIAEPPALTGTTTLPPGRSRMTTVDARGAAAGPDLPSGADLRAVAPRRRGAVVRRVTGGGREDLLWLGPDGARTTLATINAAMGEVEAPTVRAIRHPGPAGEALASWLVLPPRPSGGPSPPLVVIPYPGLTFGAPPDLVRAGRGSDLERAALLAGHGYAVLLPSLPSGPADAGPGVGLAGRVLAIVQAAARQPDLKGAFDPERLGLWGFSFGGYGVLAMLTETDRFRVAIAKSPITDFFSAWGDLPLQSYLIPEAGPLGAWPAGWMEDLQGDMRGPPWTRPDRYLRNSPALNAGRITTPVMLLHGDLDSISVAQSEEMFTALFRQGKDAVLVVYPGEAHGVNSPGNLRDYYRRSLDWLDGGLTAPASGPPKADPAPASASDGPRTPPAPPG